MAAEQRERSDRSGELIADKYRLIRPIGHGGIGAVYEAQHRFTGKSVALKLIDHSVSQFEGFGARFLREARVAGEVDHPVICDVLDAGQEPDGTLYLALELLEGRTLEGAMASGELEREELLEVFTQLLEGLAAAHDSGVVHRDIKPENIFLTWDGRGELRVKLLDFGVAKRTKAPEVFQTEQGAVLGTPYYMAPEQAAGEEVDTRADIWSAGAVLFHALTGRPPFEETTYNRLIGRLMRDAPPRLSEVLADCPPWLATVVDTALQRDIEVRWQSARTMVEALRGRSDAVLELDWEVHEDATVRTDSVHETRDEVIPTIHDIEGRASGNIEVDLDLMAEARAQLAVAIDGGDVGARTPSPTEAALPGPPSARRSALVIGLAAGLVLALLTILALSVALVVALSR